MNHYDALLAQLRTVDKKLLRRLDRKRCPPEPMPHKIWYGSEIPPEEIDLFIQRGGYSCIEGTPLLLGIYEYSKNRAVLYTTVGLYTINSDFELTGKRVNWVTPKYPLRYADYKEIRSQKDRYGFFSNNIAITLKDGTADVLHGFTGLVHLACTLTLCVDYVNKFGPVESKPPFFTSSSELLLDKLTQQHFPLPDKPIYPKYIPLAPLLPEPMKEEKPKATGTDASPEEAKKKMEQFRMPEIADKPEQMITLLKEAASLGHGEALWLCAKCIELDDPVEAFRLYKLACQCGSDEAAKSLEDLGSVLSEIYLKNNNIDEMKKILSVMAAVDGTNALLLVADFYQDGRKGIPQDHEKMLRYLKTAADRGSTEAMYRLGCHLLTDNSPQRKSAGRDWIIKAATNGNMNAMLALVVPESVSFMGTEDKVDYWGRQFYANARTPKEKALIAKVMQDWAESPKEHAFWWSVEKRFAQN